MIDMELETIGHSKQKADGRALGHGRVYLFRVVVETALLAEAKDTAARFHLVDRTIALQLDFEHDFRGNDLAVGWDSADFEDSLLNE